MKIAIIGAGLAGLTVAKELHKLGHKVRVFEKSRGVGGRLANKRLTWGQADIGAQYFTARDQRFKAQVNDWLDEGVVKPWAFTPFRVTDNGLTTSQDEQTRYVGVPKMNTIAHSLAFDLNITFQTHIKQPIKTPKGWTLQLIDGSKLEESFHWVIISSPIEQSKSLLKSTSLINEFPEISHEPCWALALATKGVVNAQLQGIFGDRIVSWVSRLSARPQRDIQEDFDDLWMLHFSSEWSLQHGKDTTQNIVEIGLNWLNEKLSDFQKQPLSVMQHHQHYWRYARIKKGACIHQPLMDKHLQIGLVGDWLNGGRVEGAFLSAMDFMDAFNLSTS